MYLKKNQVPWIELIKRGKKFMNRKQERTETRTVNNNNKKKQENITKRKNIYNNGSILCGN